MKYQTKVEVIYSHYLTVEADTVEEAYQAGYDKADEFLNTAGVQAGWGVNSDVTWAEPIGTNEES